MISNFTQPSGIDLAMLGASLGPSAAAMARYTFLRQTFLLHCRAIPDNRLPRIVTRLHRLHGMLPNTHISICTGTPTHAR